MIVELIGCAGAGKTTLRRRICERGIPGSRVVAMADLLVDRPHLRRITHPTAVNIVQELGGFPGFVRAWRRDPRFVAFASGHFARHARSRYDHLNGIRGVVRKIGMYQLARDRAGGVVVLWDEGALLAAYNLFVMTDLPFGRAELELFAGLVPLPDAVVYVRAPVSSLLERARSRPDPRRQHIGKTDLVVERDIRRTVRLFDLLITTAPLAGRVIAVDNEDQDEAGRRRFADAIAGRLSRKMATDRPAGASPRGLATRDLVAGAGGPAC